MTDKTDKIIVGSQEWCAFPDLGVPAIKARVDSGATTSSIHAFNIQAFERHGEPWVSFELHPLQGNRRTTLKCEAVVVDRRVIRSSSGITEKRYVISTTLSLGKQAWNVELTLANRDSMGYRMLLGRQAMSDRILVDPSASFHCGKLNDPDIDQLYGKIEKTHGGLRIAILGTDARVYSNQRLAEAGEERGHDMMFIDVRECYTRLDATRPEVRCRGGRVLDDLDAVITRMRVEETLYGCAIARQFESIGVLSANSSKALSHARDRFYVLQRLIREGIEIPPTGFAHTPTDQRDLVDMIGGAPLVVKLLDGRQGRGSVLAETVKAAESVVKAFKAMRANLLLQGYVKEAKGRDLRCVVIDGKVVAAIERRAAPGRIRADLDQGGKSSIVRVSKEEQQLASRTARTLGLRFAGVDLIRSRSGPLVLDVSPCPGLEAVETATGKDIAGLMISSIERKLGWGRAPRQAANPKSQG